LCQCCNIRNKFEKFKQMTYESKWRPHTHTHTHTHTRTHKSWCSNELKMK